MTGLKVYERDTRLPERAGEAGLCPPKAQELLALVHEHLTRPAGPTARAAQLAYARWKPGTSCAATYGVELDDGRTTWVTWKRHRGGKAAQLERRETADEHALAACALVPFHADAEGGTSLHAFPADRVLVGLARALDLRRGARLLAPDFAERIRWRRSAAELVRYKPEHRAVLRLDLLLRDARGELVERRVGLRVLEPAQLVRVADRRASALAQCDFTPRLLRTEDRTGLLFEEWLDVESCAGDDFSRAREAGALLARLHASKAPIASTDAVPPAPLALQHFAWDERARALAASLPARGRSAQPCVWIHGDFHPDQLAFGRADGAARLLDLDALAAGARERDLAAWIADALARPIAQDFESAGAELVEGYLRAGGARPEAAELRLHVVHELAARAAASLRRLESGALERARELLERANALAARALPATSRALPARSRETNGEARARNAAAPCDSVWERALTALEQTTPPIARVDIERVSVASDGALTLQTSSAGRARWWRHAAHELCELDPARDEALPAAAEFLRGGCAVLGWRPGRRMVLLQEDPRRALKFVRRAELQRLAAAHGAIERAARSERSAFRLARVEHVDAERAHLAFEWLHGDQLDLERHRARFAGIGSRLAALQRTPDASAWPAHGVVQELAVLARWRERWTLARGARPEGFDAAHEQLAERRPANAGRGVLVHRDLHDGQLLLANDSIGLIDFDLAACGDPELDLANLEAHLELLALQGRRAANPENARRARSELRRGFAAGGAECETQRHAWYRAATFLRLALVHGLRPRSAPLSAALVRRAADELELD